MVLMCLVQLLFISLFGLAEVTACEDVTEWLPDLARRARNYVAKGDQYIDPYIDDSNLFGWFNVGNYTMPDSHTMPELETCGTYQPIYIKGNHPDKESLTEYGTSLVACERLPREICSRELEIEVRLCGNDTQYHLTHTGSQSGYCFDPPALVNITDFESAPTHLTIGQLTVSPTLAFNETSEEGHNGIKYYEMPYLRFDCVESPFIDRSAEQNLLFSTYWFVDSDLLKKSERQNDLISITESDLMENNYSLNIEIQCGIRVSTSLTGFQTEMQSSESFFAGVQIDPVVINMAKEETATVTLRPTIPFGCYAEVGDQPDGKCSMKILLQYPEAKVGDCELGVTAKNEQITFKQAKSIQSRCGTEVTGFYPYQVRTNSTLQTESVYLQIESPYLSDSDSTEYRISLITDDSGSHKIWRDVFLIDVQVNVISNTAYKNKVCYAHVDPHMMSADGQPYENNDNSGLFILYEHDTGIQIQIKTTKCNNNLATCICAVAIRAGGDVFLINLCGGLRFIDMTSCKDGGVLIVRKYSEVNYQVLTNIGTLVMINILTGRYQNLMNLDLHMAPKDYNRIKGLCGTFDGNIDNDFHNRNGKTVGITDFIQAWLITASDTNLLDPTCNVTVNTWAEDGELLYCICNCHKKDECDTLEKTATCSPSQYANCTVSLKKTSELCQDYEKRCNQQAITRRSAFYTNPEVEMKRRAKLADLPHRFVVKRQTEDTNTISEDIARTACVNKIVTEKVEKHSHLLGGFNISQAITECTWDVSTGQDFGWTDTHKQAADSAIAAGYQRDANYTKYHIDEFKEFKSQTCPYDCSGNGNCLENGTCTCNGEYFGPDCANNRSVGPDIEDIEGGGFCDQRYGSECRCFSVQAAALTESFKCKRITKKKMLDGESVSIGSESREGRFRNLYNGECCFDEGRRKRSSDIDTEVMHYLYDISISNDGQKFGPVTIVYVFDSLCLSTDYDDERNVAFTLKNDTCLIDGSCYEHETVDSNNVCFKCDPNKAVFNWTDGCVSSKDKEEGSIDVLMLATIAFGAFVFLFAVVIILVVCIKKENNHRRSISASQFSSGAMLSKIPSRMSYHVRNLTFKDDKETY